MARAQPRLQEALSPSRSDLLEGVANGSISPTRQPSPALPHTGSPGAVSAHSSSSSADSVSCVDPLITACISSILCPVLCDVPGWPLTGTNPRWNQNLPAYIKCIPQEELDGWSVATPTKQAIYKPIPSSALQREYDAWTSPAVLTDNRRDPVADPLTVAPELTPQSAEDGALDVLRALNVLTSMGFEEGLCRKAIEQCGTAEAATEWLLQHQMDGQQPGTALKREYDGWASGEGRIDNNNNTGSSPLVFLESPAVLTDNRRDLSPQSTPRATTPSAAYSPMYAAAAPVGRVLHVPAVFPTVEAAVAAARPGDRVRVAPEGELLPPADHVHMSAVQRGAVRQEHWHQPDGDRPQLLVEPQWEQRSSLDKHVSPGKACTEADREREA